MSTANQLADVIHGKQEGDKVEQLPSTKADEQFCPACACKHLLHVLFFNSNVSRRIMKV